MFTPKCGPSEATYGPVSGVIACYNYLKNLGTKACRVPANRKVVEFCRSGKSHATGQSLTSKAESSHWYVHTRYHIGIVEHGLIIPQSRCR